MAAETEQRTSLSIDIEPGLGPRIEAAATARNLSVHDYAETTLRAALESEDHTEAPLPDRMTDEDRERGLRALENLERLDRELLAQRGGKPFPPSWKLINEARDERTRELMQEQ